jgi:hypothetical protein
MRSRGGPPRPCPAALSPEAASGAPARPRAAADRSRAGLRHLGLLPQPHRAQPPPHWRQASHRHRARARDRGLGAEPGGRPLRSIESSGRGRKRRPVRRGPRPRNSRAASPTGRACSPSRPGASTNSNRARDAERPAGHDPHLAESLHDVLTTAAAIRSASAILARSRSTPPGRPASTATCTRTAAAWPMRAARSPPTSTRAGMPRASSFRRRRSSTPGSRAGLPLAWIEEARPRRRTRPHRGARARDPPRRRRSRAPMLRNTAGRRGSCPRRGCSTSCTRPGPIPARSRRAFGADYPAVFRRIAALADGAGHVGRPRRLRRIGHDDLPQVGRRVPAAALRRRLSALAALPGAGAPPRSRSGGRLELVGAAAAASTATRRRDRAPWAASAGRSSRGPTCSSCPPPVRRRGRPGLPGWRKLPDLPAHRLRRPARAPGHRAPNRGHRRF